MSRYIDADEFEKRIKSYNTDDCVDKAMYNFAHNIMIFTSTADVLERKVGNKKERTMIPNKCPHCGAPINMARAICEYCGTSFKDK